MHPEIEAIRPESDASNRPVYIRFIAPLADATIDEAVFEFVEPQLQGTWGLCVVAAQRYGPIVVHPLKMYRVDRVLLALEPIARHVREHDLAEAICESEWFPYGQFGRRLRPHIGPQQARQFAHRRVSTTGLLHRFACRHRESRGRVLH